MSLPFDPDAPARTTDSLQVGMVRRLVDDQVLDVLDWLGSQTLGDIHSLRPRIRQDQADAQFVCFCCGHPILLRQHANGGHFFAHKEKSQADKANCLYQEGRNLSLADLDRLRYQGLREGARHRRTKDLIARILSADPRFSPPVIERTWTTFADGWRKPDVATSLGDLPVVFEAQVSNTYPQVVAERTEFYRKQGALLIWIFDQMPDTHWRTLHADTFCANHQHLFLVDDDCAAVAEQTQVATFRIYSLRPSVEAYRPTDEERWHLRPFQEERCDLTAFSSLSLNASSQTATLFDVVEENKRVQHKILCANAQADCDYDALEVAIREIIKRKGPVPRKNLQGWAALVCAIEAHRLGHPVGTRLANTAGLQNLIYNHYPAFFPHLVTTLDRLGVDPPEQRHGAWKKWVDAFHRGQFQAAAHVGSDHLLAWLYP